MLEAVKETPTFFEVLNLDKENSLRSEEYLFLLIVQEHILGRDFLGQKGTFRDYS